MKHLLYNYIRKGFQFVLFVLVKIFVTRNKLRSSAHFVFTGLNFFYDFADFKKLPTLDDFTDFSGTSDIFSPTSNYV